MKLTRLMRGACVALALVPFFAGAQDVLLVRGTASVPAGAERKYAESLTRRLGRWLDECGVPHTVVADEDLAARAATTRLAILGYNPNPPPSEMAALRRILAGGGKLMVFYGASQELAGLMGFRLAPYQGVPLGGRWSRMRFTTAAPPGSPVEVLQESRHHRAAHPASRQARVMAVWMDAAGKKTADPAWVTSPQGFWMSHVLLDDGDTVAKQQLLLALAASCDPSLWAGAARKRYRELSSRLKDLEKQVRRDAPAKESAAVSREIGRALGDVSALINRSRYREALEAADGATARVRDAYAALQKPQRGEFRAVWDHTPYGLYPGQWSRTGQRLADAGITDLFANMVWAGLAHYPSRVVPQSDLVRRHGDPLAACLKGMRGSGVQVHVWKVCWNLVKAPPDFVAQMRRAGRLQVSDTGKTVDWLCPVHPENRRMEKDVIRELARGYDIDGIHLDYIRYPNSRSCYCAECRRQFEVHRGRKMSAWPRDVRQGPHAPAYALWRAARMTDFVRDVQVLLENINPDIRLSVAVYGKYPLCIQSIGQDWGRWMREDLVDFVCPMNYSNDLGTFEGWLREQFALPGSRGHLYPGIGVTATESQLDAVDVIQQIRSIRGFGGKGFALFSLNRELEKEILPALCLGMTRKK